MELPSGWRLVIPRQLQLTVLLPLAMVLVLLLLPGTVQAAELRQVRGSSLLQVGDSNRSYAVRLACITVAEDQEQEAVLWLRQTVNRGSRLKLRPMGERDGELLALVSRLPRGQLPSLDLASGLVAAGLATPLAGTTADPACPPLA
jgi:hypothetical protein